MQVVEITWIDSCTVSGWKKGDVHRTIEPIICHTIGYLVRKDKKAITVIQSYSEDDGVADSMTIPKACVQRVRVLRGR